jgi:hypothetical protein
MHTNELWKFFVGSDPEIAPAPDDSTEGVFLGRAYHRLGRAKFGDAWTGFEPRTVLPELLPDAIEPYAGLRIIPFCDVEEKPKDPQAEWYDPPSRRQRTYALDLLYKYRPDIRSSPQGFIIGHSNAAPGFTLTQWKVAQGLNRKQYHQSEQSIQRNQQLTKAIAELLEGNILVSMLRPLGGGEFSAELPAWVWRTENFGYRFTKWTMLLPEKLAAGTERGREQQFIFVSRDSLIKAEAKLNAIRGVSIPAPRNGYQSEILQFLQQVSNACGMSHDKPPKKAVVEKAIINLWPFTERPGATELKYMASFVRPLHARNAKNGGPAPKKLRSNPKG